MTSSLRKILILGTILLVPTLLFKDSFNNFFFQDDFFNMALANTQGPLASFNIFTKPPLDFYFYRPLSTQFFWWLGQKTFGLGPLGYHLLLFAFFLLNIFLVYRLSCDLTTNRKVVFLTTFFYAVSASHFYRLFFLSQFQEILLMTLSLITIIFYLHGSKLALLSFLLALMAKETAVAVPLILLIYELMFRRRHFVLLLSIFAALIFYFVARKLFFGFAAGAAYEFSFAPKAVLNNYLWYSLWSLGLPEAYVNLKIFTLPTIFNPKLFTEFGPWGNRTLLFMTLFLTMTVLAFRHWWQRQKRAKELLLFGLAFFVVSLLPVAFFPFHKFAYSVTLPLFGLSLILGMVLGHLDGSKAALGLALYLLMAFSATQFNLSNHWAKKRANTANLVWQYLKTNYSNPNSFGSDIYFVDRPVFYCWPQRSKFQESQEVAYALGGEGGLRLLYHDASVKIYFEDWDNFKHFSRFSLVLDSNKFLP